MPPATLDDDIAKLYQLPLSEFTAARNVLAKRAGPRGAELRALAKPSAAAWAVNQVFWRDHVVYDHLIEAAGDMRAAHAAVLAGQSADVRAVGKAHEEAIAAATRSALAILREADQPATEATRQAITTTLRALPGPDPPGRLSSTLQPGGLEMLAGLDVRSKILPSPHPAARPAIKEPEPVRPQVAPTARSPRPPAVDPEAQRRAKAEADEADRAVRLAEHAAHREAFEAARASRQAEKAAKAVAEARAAVEEAERALAEAEAVAADAEDAKTSAATRASEADAALKAARERARTLRPAARIGR